MTVASKAKFHDTVGVATQNKEVDGIILVTRDARDTRDTRDAVEADSYRPILLAALERHELLTESEHTADWQIECTATPRQLWLYARNRHGMMPSHGWKLHVSASPVDARRILEQALPVLFAEDATFKVCASSDALLYLNQGQGGLSQVGKFITVYPNSDEQAVRLALALDKATHGLRAPDVLSDRALNPNSLVHYRYGTFHKQHMHTKLGSIVSAYRTPDGDMVQDYRTPFYKSPAWAVDPFDAAGAAAPPRQPVRLVGNRYVIIAPLKESPRGVIFDAVDTVKPRRCIIKYARRNGAMTLDGRDACNRLRTEAQALRRMLPNPTFPEFYGLHEENGEPYLVMERIEGLTVETHVRQLTIEYGTVPGNELLRWTRELASALHAIHSAGLIYRDLKSANAMITPEGHVRLIDFDLAYECDAPLPQYNVGTRGYMSPQHRAWESAHVTDDVYSYGALLYFLATGAEPSSAPDDANLLSRPITLLNPALSPDFVAFIECCLHPDRELRFQSMPEVIEALSRFEQVYTSPPAWGQITPIASSHEQIARYKRYARQLGETLCEIALPADNGHGLVWPGARSANDFLTSRDIVQSRYINLGVAGQVLALAELVLEFNDPAQRRALEGGVRWLLSEQRLAGEPVAGLYLGEAGVALALLRAGHALGDASLIEAASRLGKWVATLPHETPCLFTGTAGRLRHHLMLWDATSDPYMLRHASTCGERLLTQADTASNNGLSWLMPATHGTAQANIGYAHGAAGIGDALIDLYEATYDNRYLDAASAAGRWVAGLAKPILNETLDGLNWPRYENAGLNEGVWCHGAAGIGTFMLRAAQAGILDGAFEMAHRAAVTVAHSVRAASPIQCHGLAGNIGFLLDMHQATGDPSYLAEAESLAELMGSFAANIDGLLVFSGESPTKFTPAYTVGFSGIAMCLLRLADPARRPQQISRAGFKYKLARNPESL